jgi:archaemetzincin
MYLATIGPVDPDILSAVDDHLGRVFQCETRRMGPFSEPIHAFDARRRQYSSSVILRDLVPGCPPDAARLLAVTELDLYIPMLTFIFGQAQLGGSLAIVSLARLRQEFYGLPPSRALLRERTFKEVLHELGHTLNLVHCPDTGCAMSLSTGIRQLDAKGSGYCPGCAALLEESLRNMRKQS